MPSNFYAVAKIKREFVVPFIGLKIGSHSFEFEVTDAFFENVEYSLIEKGNVQVTFVLEKKETMMIGDFTIKGKVETNCDLCDDPVTVDVKGEYQLIYKFDDEPSNDESLIIVYPEEFELDLKDSILEFITVSLPARKLHPKGGCNEEMIEILDQYRVDSYYEYEEDELDEDEFDDDTDDEQEGSEDLEEDSKAEDDGEIDPRWAALKGLKKDN